MKRIISLILALCSIFCIASATTVSASAAEYNFGVEYLEVYKNGEYVNVVAWLEENGDVYLPNFENLRKLFPEETADLVSVAIVEPIGLETFTEKFGYTMKTTSDERLLVNKKDGNGNNGGEVTIPRNYLAAYRDGKSVAVTIWQEEDGAIYLSSYADLTKLFPSETADLVFPAVVEPVELKTYVEKFDYSQRLEGKNLYLTKNSSGNNGSEVTIPRTYLTAYRDNKFVDVTIWKEENGKIYLASYAEVQKLFPNETSGLVFPTVVEPVELKTYVEKFDYSQRLEGKNLYLTKNSSGNNGGEVTIPRTYLIVYKDNKFVDVTIWKEENGKIYLASYAEVQKLFPNETSGLVFPTVIEPVELKTYTEKFGYAQRLDGKNLYLAKNGGSDVTVPHTTLKVYKENSYVKVSAWLEEDGKVYLESYSELKVLFPSETVGLVFPAVVEPVELKTYSDKFGYSFKVDGTNLYVTKNVPNTNQKVDLTTYRDGKKVDIKAWQIGEKVYVKSYKDLFKLFAEETKLHKCPDIRGEVELAGYADMFGFSITVKNGRLDVNTKKVNTKGVEIWINGKLLSIPSDIPEPFVTNGTTLVPVRLVTEALGATVDWYSGKPYDLVTVVRDEVSLMIYVGTKNYTCNGKPGQAGTETVYKTVNGKTSTMLPLRVISESLGASITWDSRTNRVLIVDSYLLK